MAAQNIITVWFKVSGPLQYQVKILLAGNALVLLAGNAVVADLPLAQPPLTGTSGKVLTTTIPLDGRYMYWITADGFTSVSGALNVEDTGFGAQARVVVSMTTSTGMLSSGTCLGFDINNQVDAYADVTLVPSGNQAPWATKITIPQRAYLASLLHAPPYAAQIPFGGQYQVTITAPGYITMSQIVDAKSGETTYIRTPLTRVKMTMPQIALQVTVRNRADNSILSTAVVTEQVDQGPVSGNGTMFSPGKNVKVVGKATGYVTGTSWYVVKEQSSGVQAVDLQLDASAIPPVTITLTSDGSNRIAGAQVTLTGLGSATSDAKGVATFPSVAPGTYSVSVNASGYNNVPNPGSIAVTAAATQADSGRSFTLQLTSTPSQVESPQALPASTTALEDPAQLYSTQQVAELTYDNSAYQGYYTSAQCQLSIGDLFIDELVTVQYALQHNVVPVFGYCSAFADAYGRGRSLVQGQLVLNFVHQGYLYAALSRYAQTVGKTPEKDSNEQLATQLMRLVQAQQDPQLSDAWKKKAADQLAQLLPTASPAVIQTANYLLRAGRSSLDSYTANPVYLHQTFDMKLVIGDGAYQTVRMLEKCILGANEQIVDARSGEVIAESYAFTARRLR